MKKVSILFTGVYVKFNEQTKERALRYNYVVVAGDVKDFVADKNALGYGSIQSEGEHAGKPRIGLLKDIGETGQLQRVLKKDGTYDWYTDETDTLVMESLINGMSAAAKQEYARDEVREMRAKAMQLSASIRAKRAQTIENATIEAKQNAEPNLAKK
jgi:hypothetical protein